MLFIPTYKLVQDLLAAKRDLELPRALRKLDRFELLILDDIGYARQDAEQVEVPQHRSRGRRAGKPRCFGSALVRATS